MSELGSQRTVYHKETVMNELAEPIVPSTHHFYKWKNSFPRNIHCHDLLPQLAELGYDIDHLPPRNTRDVYVCRPVEIFKIINDFKNDNMSFVDEVDLGMWCSDIEGDIPQDVHDALKQFNALMNAHMYKSKKRKVNRPIGMFLRYSSGRVDGSHYTKTPAVFEKYLEVDDDYFNRLKYLKEKELES